MKKAKNEQKDSIDMLVDYYLNRRNYSRPQNSSKNVKTDTKTYNVKEMIECLLADNQRNNNCVQVFESAQNESHSNAFEETFNNFVNFVTGLEQEYKTESNKLLFHIFTHYCIESIESGASNAAKKLFAKYSQTFLQNGIQKPLIESLATSIGNQSLDNRLKIFRKTKCAINITEKYLQHLIHFLENLHHFTLHRIINNCIDFTLISSNSGEEHSVTSTASKYNLPETKPSVNELSTKMKIEEIIKKMRDQPPSVSCICLCSIDNVNPTCVSVRKDLQYLSAGFETSDIHVWPLTSQMITKEEDNLSKITLSVQRSENKVNSSHNSSFVDDVNKCVLRGHSDAVYQTCFVPDTDLLLSCSEDATVRAWNTSTMCGTQIYSGHDYPIWCLDASSFGFYFATGSKDTTARLWSIDRRYPLRIYAGHTMDIDCVKFHPNCNYIATGSCDKTVRLWSVTDAKMVRVFQGHSGNVHALAFTPDGKILVSAGEDRKIRLWDISSGALIKEFRGHNDTIYSMAINAEQSILASCGLDHSLKLWDLNRITQTGCEPKAENDSKSDLKLENNSCDSISMEPLITYPTKYSLIMSQFMPHNLLVVFGAK